MSNSGNRKMALYRITFPNNKLYFGISVNPEKRIRRHRYHAQTGKRNFPLYRALKKYLGKERFEVIIWGNPEDIKAEEIRLIRKYKSYDREYGYNVSLGGDAVMLGRNHTEESKAKMSKTHQERGHPRYWKGKKFSNEHREKMRLARAGKPGPNKGKKLNPEWRKAISKATFGINNHFYGRTHSAETLEKMRISQRKWREEKKTNQK